MAFCEECGSRIPDGADKCPACGAAVAAPQQTQNPNTGYGQQNTGRERQSAPSYRPAAGGRVDNLVLAENEKIVRQYQCSNVKQPRCVGYLTVTNKRILFQGKAATSCIAKEVVLDSVSGLDCYYGLNVNGGLLALGVLLALAGLFLLINDGDMAVWGLLAIVLGVVLIVLSFQKSFFLAIFSSKANGSPISIGAGARSLVGNGALYSLISEPTADTDRMLNELGALVQDLQTLGDHAIEKWSK